MKYAANILNMVNIIRIRHGKKPFLSHKELQIMAENISMRRAKSDRHGHLYRFAQKPATNEGVGYDSRRDFEGRYFKTCYYLDNFTYAGAALSVTAYGTFYTLCLIK